MMVDGRADRCGEVENSDGRQRRCPERRRTEPPQRGQKRPRHDQPRRQPAAARRRRPGQRGHRRHDEYQPQPQRGQKEKKRRMAQLHIGRARHHAPDIGKPRIDPDGARQTRMAEPDRSARFHRRRQRHVVDQRAADGGDAADAIERLPADQHCATGRGRGGAPRRVDPGERIQQSEQIGEGRHQRPFGAAFAPQRNHFADHLRAASLGLGQEGGEMRADRARCRHR